MELAELESEEDRQAVGDVVRRSMRASYSLSPEQLDAVVEEEFTDDALAEKAQDDDVVQVVARREGELVGFAEGTADDATVRWLYVAPEARGEGVGTELFEELRDRVAADGAVTGRVLAQNQEGSAFFERFDLEPVGDEQVELGGEELTERIFADPDRTDAAPGEAEGGTETGGDTSATGERDADIPETLTVGGQERYVDRDDPESGTLGPMFPVFTDEAREDLYGFYCGNSGTFTDEVDEQGRIRCGECGNVHRPDDWDSSYL